MTRNYRNFARSLDRPDRPGRDYSHWLRLLLDAGCDWHEADRVAREMAL